MAQPAGEPEAAAPGSGPDAERLRGAGERIETLLEASAAGGAVARERAEELVRLVVDLYGAGLARVLEILREHDALDASLRRALADDELVASLLMVHGLHPDDVPTRVRSALDDVRPYLGSHGGDVELLGVDDAGVVTLRMLGSCDGCPSSSVTLTLAVESAVQAAAPEVTAIEVEPASPSRTGAPAALIPVGSLRSRLDSDAGQSSAAGDDDRAGGVRWYPVPDLADLAAGQVGGFDVDGVAVLACRAGGDLLAYTDRCPRCEDTMAGAVLVAGRSADAPAVRCPGCGCRYDVRAAGAGLDDAGEHLQPLPLLVRDGVPAVAVPPRVPA